MGAPPPTRHPPCPPAPAARHRSVLASRGSAWPSLFPGPAPETLAGRGPPVGLLSPRLPSPLCPLPLLSRAAPTLRAEARWEVQAVGSAHSTEPQDQTPGRGGLLRLLSHPTSTAVPTEPTDTQIQGEEHWTGGHAVGTQLQGTEHWGQGHGQGCAHTTGEGRAHSPSHGGRARGPRGHCGMGLGDVLGAPPGDGSWTEAQLCPETAEGGCLHGGGHVSQPETMGQGPTGLGEACQGLKQGLPNHPGSPEPGVQGKQMRRKPLPLPPPLRGFWGPAGKAGLETPWGSGPSHGAWPDCPVAPLPIWEGGEPSNGPPT